MEMEECLNCKINRSSISSPRSANPSVSAGYSLSSVPLLIQKKKVLEESSVFYSFKHKCILKLKRESILAVNHGYQNQEKIPPLLEEEVNVYKSLSFYMLSSTPDLGDIFVRNTITSIIKSSLIL